MSPEETAREYLRLDATEPKVVLNAFHEAERLATRARTYSNPALVAEAVLSLIRELREGLIRRY